MDMKENMKMLDNLAEVLHQLTPEGRQAWIRQGMEIASLEANGYQVVRKEEQR